MVDSHCIVTKWDGNKAAKAAKALQPGSRTTNSLVPRRWSRPSMSPLSRGHPGMVPVAFHDENFRDSEMKSCDLIVSKMQSWSSMGSEPAAKALRFSSAWTKQNPATCLLEVRDCDYSLSLCPRYGKAKTQPYFVAISTLTVHQSQSVKTFLQPSLPRHGHNHPRSPTSQTCRSS